ncbi:2-hydroxy-6-oxo-2,4-heptadienoate hydrolase [Candidatus Pelagibacter sp.]|jgi:tetratricopeptide (TPR) repeat protein|nr:2-hydroxy-6-oxo-2,4-heptadienoate hydrolase [Candidatus Pelagibacter sp.]|tara:strand:- start:133 stop:678 length:546 start_codon:yes stop_codon:yes gene_type:complete
MRILILIFFLFFNLTNADSLDQKNKLDALFNQLKKVNNSKTAELLEKKIWAVWSQHPEDKKLTEKLEFGSELMQYGSYDYALKVFDNIINTDPEWSEAWNKRATVFFLMNQYTKSLDDIEKVLNIESRHFGALSGQARIFIKLQEYEKAIISLESALKFYPSFKSGDLIPEIERLIKSESI